MSVRAKRGTLAQVNAAATANELKIGELIFLTDQQKFVVATATNMFKEAPPPYATKAQAEAGTATDVAMNPLRTAQYVNIQKGAINGVATLDGGGKVPKSQMPLIGYGEVGSYVIAGSTEHSGPSTGAGTVYNIGSTVAGSTLIQSSTVNSTPSESSLGGSSPSNMIINHSQSFSLNLSGTWSLLTRVRGSANFRPLGLFQRIA